MADELIPEPTTAELVRAAGIYFLAKDQALFVRRSDGSGWCLPGGRIEGDESAEAAAIREAFEETGHRVDGPLAVWTRRQADGADFTTFVSMSDEQFTPILNHEHDAWAWADPANPPQPLHPGMSIVLRRAGMTELDVARAIQSGELTSPQRVGAMALFNIRITGTGTAYRTALKEFVYRRPENYLTDEFLARCNGLAVIFQHPEKAMLNSDEFNDRIVGTVLLPYILGDEVWAIAKIYDAPTIALMENLKLSTSPGVALGNSADHKTLTLDDGATLLIEGNPELVDHIAICANGVWDKGGEPAGVIAQTSGAVQMTEEEKAALAKKDADEKEAKEKADAEAKAKADADPLNKLCDAVGALAKRLDAMEMTDAARKDAEEKAEKEKADAEEKEKEEKAKADSAETRAQIAALDARIPAILSDADRNAIADATARFDSVAQLFGKPVSQAVAGESPLAYRKRIASQFKAHSPSLKDADLSKLDDAHFGVIEDRILADAVIAANKPGAVPANQLIRRTRNDGYGHIVHEFIGDSRAAWEPFRAQGQVGKFRQQSEARN